MREIEPVYTGWSSRMSKILQLYTLDTMLLLLIPVCHLNYTTMDIIQTYTSTDIYRYNYI